MSVGGHVAEQVDGRGFVGITVRGYVGIQLGLDDGWGCGFRDGDADGGVA